MGGGSRQTNKRRPNGVRHSRRVPRKICNPFGAAYFPTVSKSFGGTGLTILGANTPLEPVRKICRGEMPEIADPIALSPGCRFLEADDL